MYQALYRKYRPATFSDVSGQDHITVTLKNQVDSGNISHAYLFTGSRGTGKTSCAKILSRAINCLNLKDGDPCGECEGCKSILNETNLDVMEIDAASNNGVDSIRDLREKVGFTPANSKYRVYIVDEVHMLSAAAFNALLKTLEEPPSHVVFILATTEVHKLPATVLSRCQRFDFKRIDPEVIADRLMYIAQKENINLNREAALVIAGIADGGMRDALSILDLCVGLEGEITSERVSRLCGRAGRQHLHELCEMIADADVSEALKKVSDLYDDSIDMQRLCEEMIEYYRTLMLINVGSNVGSVAACTDSEREKYQHCAKKSGIENNLFSMRVLGDALNKMTTANRRYELEMAIVKLCSPKLDNSYDALASRIEDLERGAVLRPKEPTVSKVNETVFMPTENRKAVSKRDEIKTERLTPPSEEPTKKEGRTARFVLWDEVLSSLQKTAPLMYGMLRGTAAYTEGDRLLISSESAQLADMLKQKDSINYKALYNAILTAAGKEYDPIIKPKSANSLDPLDALMKTVSDLEIPTFRK